MIENLYNMFLFRDAPKTLFPTENCVFKLPFCHKNIEMLIFLLCFILQRLGFLTEKRHICSLIQS